MRLRIEPEPTTQEAEAIAIALEVLAARSGAPVSRLRFNCDGEQPRDYTWRDMARIEALTPGV
jgi:hypothetical protein